MASRKNVKNGKNKKKNNNVSAVIKSEDNEATKLFKMILVVVALFLIFWGITYFVTNKMKNSSDNSSSKERLASIQYDQILVGTILSQKRNKYYVFLDKFTSDDYATYSSSISEYGAKDGALKVYTVDMDDPFNKQFYGDEVNITDEDLSEFKVNEVTLLYIEDGKISEYFTGKDDVTEKLTELKA